jgi:hypothetical protein
MAKFAVILQEVHTYTVIVDAPDDSAAEEWGHEQGFDWLDSHPREPDSIASEFSDVEQANESSPVEVVVPWEGE